MKTIVLFLLLLLGSGTWAQEKFTVYFDFNKQELSPVEMLRLQEWIALADDLEITKIYGFCDWKGTNLYNDTLSVKRVNTVLTLLKDKNIKSKEGYEIRGFGEDFEQSKVQALNRKVIIAYETKKQETNKLSSETRKQKPLQERFKTAKVQDTIRLKNLYFYNMTPRVLVKSKPILYELLCALQDNPKLKVEIQGHICCQKDFDINNLSEMRARAVFNFLVSNRINRKRLTFKGYGTSKPIYAIPERNEFEENENRRVEILVLEN